MLTFASKQHVTSVTIDYGGGYFGACSSYARAVPHSVKVAVEDGGEVYRQAALAEARCSDVIQIDTDCSQLTISMWQRYMVTYEINEITVVGTGGASAGSSAGASSSVASPPPPLPSAPPPPPPAVVISTISAYDDIDEVNPFSSLSVGASVTVNILTFSTSGYGGVYGSNPYTHDSNLGKALKHYCGVSGPITITVTNLGSYSGGFAGSNVKGALHVRVQI